MPRFRALSFGEIISSLISYGLFSGILPADCPELVLDFGLWLY